MFSHCQSTSVERKRQDAQRADITITMASAVITSRSKEVLLKTLSLPLPLPLTYSFTSHIQLHTAWDVICIYVHLYCNSI